MKSYEDLGRRSSPALPTLEGFAACSDPLPLVVGARQPDPVVRPLYWWARELAAGGSVLRALYYVPHICTAGVAVQLPSYRVLDIARSQAGELLDPVDLPHVLAESVWRLGVSGWAKEIDNMIPLLRGMGLMVPIRAVPRCSTHIPGLVRQPPRQVRVAYWWVQTLRNHGWQLHEVGQPTAGGGFIAQIPSDGGEPVVIVYPYGMDDDGTAASALANSLRRLKPEERGYLRRLVADMTEPIRPDHPDGG